MYEDLINIMFKNFKVSEEDIDKYFDMKYDYQKELLKTLFNQKKEKSNE